MYRLIEVSGMDRQDFLQGQLTQDLGLLTDHGSLLAAWCNPGGRVIATIRLLALDDAIGLVVAADMAGTVCENLARFRFRAKVDFAAAADHWDCIAVRQPSNGAQALAADGVTAVSYASEMPITEYFGSPEGLAGIVPPGDERLSDTQWQQALIQAGVPVISMANSEKFTPHMLNLDLLGAISFRKGCYTGQEIVARTENLGSSKRRILRYTSATKTLVAGDRLSLDGKNIGEVVNASSGDLLAVAPLKLQGQSLMAGATDITPAALPYAITS